MAFRLLLAGAVVLAIYMALVPRPPQLPIDQFGDKFGHVLAFATLALLAALAYPRASVWRIGERLSFLGALIEVFQALPSLHRDCDYRDWVADTLAIAVVLLLVTAIRSRRPAVFAT